GYVGHAWACAYAEGRLGVIFPTGGRIRNEPDNNPKLLLLLPRGANGHFGIRCGAEADWLIRDWCVVKAYGSYVFMLPWNEKVAASFQGATIKNIGPTVTAKVSWHYFLGTLDLCLIHPYNPSLGIDLAYQFYVKSKDRIKFKDTMAVDFLGNAEPLDATVLEQRTNVVSNKLMATLFYQGSYWELFARGARIIAGKNVPRESEVVVGITINF
ncbi:MAG TPA: hypothetical protein VLG71_02875, partial [Candidatus Limnocylindria bacterium]|nr:hypothetical protein [Candidatus Limnocylindria bacterium]